MKYIKVFTATNAYDLQYDVMEYEQNKKHIPVNQSCSVANSGRETMSSTGERYLLTVTYDDGSPE